MPAVVSLRSPVACRVSKAGGAIESIRSFSPLANSFRFGSSPILEKTQTGLCSPLSIDTFRRERLRMTRCLVMPRWTACFSRRRPVFAIAAPIPETQQTQIALLESEQTDRKDLGRRFSELRPRILMRGRGESGGTTFEILTD